VAREQRKLAAILAADVVSYSRLMGRDESGALAYFRTNRVERLDHVQSKSESRPVVLAGDGVQISSVPLPSGRLKI